MLPPAAPVEPPSTVVADQAANPGMGYVGILARGAAVLAVEAAFADGDDDACALAGAELRTPASPFESLDAVSRAWSKRAANASRPIEPRRIVSTIHGPGRTPSFLARGTAKNSPMVKDVKRSMATWALQPLKPLRVCSVTNPNGPSVSITRTENRKKPADAIAGRSQRFFFMCILLRHRLVRRVCGRTMTSEVKVRLRALC
jgi:hypothetical protein